MKSGRKKLTNPESPVRKRSKTVAARTQGAEPEAPLWALLPSAAELRQMVARPANDTSFRSSDAHLGAALDISPALLNPLASLPRPISLDEVKEPLRATVAARKTQTK